MSTQPEDKKKAANYYQGLLILCEFYYNSLHTRSGTKNQGIRYKSPDYRPDSLRI